MTALSSFAPLLPLLIAGLIILAAVMVYRQSK